MCTIANERASRNPLDTLYQFPIVANETYFHEDLDAMTVPELRRELARVRFRLEFERRPHPWLLERFERVRRSLDNADPR